MFVGCLLLIRGYVALVCLLIDLFAGILLPAVFILLVLDYGLVLWVNFSYCAVLVIVVRLDFGVSC